MMDCFKEGCISEWADNYDELATQNTLIENECYRRVFQNGQITMMILLLLMMAHINMAARQIGQITMMS